jgi:hypothetical protein
MPVSWQLSPCVMPALGPAGETCGEERLPPQAGLAMAAGRWLRANLDREVRAEGDRSR